MATMDQVINAITQQGGKILKRDGDFTIIEFPTDNGRSQVLFVGSFGNGNLQLARFLSPVCNVSNVAAATLLQESSLFGYTQVGDTYCVTTSVLLNTIDTEELSLILYGLLPQADQLERKFTGGDNL